ncbi:3-beta hydroxysteroid dehydrogenase [Rhizobium leguminosarum bv. trifolii]|nr:3-beta hydroxysteroid dehydrogenase [Rhizobium leguminosarum bv. trifolii]
MGRVSNKVAIVTGAAAGLGAAIATMLAREGARVVLTDLDQKRGSLVADQIVGAGGEAMFLEHEVSDERRWLEVVDKTLGQFGKLDVLVNNAGVQFVKRISDTTLEDWRRLFQVNVEGVFLGTRTAMSAMRQNGSGSIINLSSTMDRVVSVNDAAYCASKAAVTHFTKAAALDGATDGNRIRVNSIHPGLIETPMVEREILDLARLRGDVNTDAVRAKWDALCPLGMGKPEDIAYGALYLASDESKLVTGSELVIDGGHLLKR